MMYLPPAIATQENMESWPRSVLDEWRQLKLTEAEAEWKYVKLAEKLPLYGSELFGANKVRIDPTKRLPKPVGIAVNCSGVTFYDEANKVKNSYRYGVYVMMHDVCPLFAAHLSHTTVQRH